MPVSPSRSQILQEIVTTLLREREVAIFLGAGSSQEGRQGDRPFPAFSELIDHVLTDAGIAPDGKEDRLALFQEVVNRWYAQRQSLSVVFEDYLYGRPGFAHYLLAALSLSLFPDSRILLYLTTNYDDLMARAFHDFERAAEKTKTVTLSIPRRPTGREAEHLFEAAEAHVRNGRPVIVKLFGDLDSQPPIFKTTDVQLEPEVEESLEAVFKGPVIFIGYSFMDSTIIELIQRSHGRAPLFIVTPQERLPEAIEHHRRASHLKQTFAEFMTSLLPCLRGRDSAAAQRLDTVLQGLQPGLFYTTAEAVRFRAREASQISLLRAQERLAPHGEKSQSGALLIDREESQPDVERFLDSDQPLLAIVGDSGTGKSTFLYQLYERLNSAQPRRIPLLYDVHQLQPRGSLSAQLAVDFCCSSTLVHSLLETFNNVLLAGGQSLVILVDALNESSPIPPSVLKADIEGLGARFGRAIKLIYTCRKVYWDTHLAAGAALPSRLYFGAKEQVLGKFSLREARRAFEAYQGRYGFRGSFQALRKELQERLCDPLMLRMLAEGYQDRQLPEFAPAVLIFDSYFAKLVQRFRGTNVVPYLERMVATRVEALDSGEPVSSDLFGNDLLLHDPVLYRLTLLQNSSAKLPGDPSLILEDEGVLTALDAERSVVKFTYDRFYEYVLGRALGASLKTGSAAEFLAWFRRQTVAAYAQHFSFLEALKSEVLRLNLAKPDGPWSLYSTATLTALLGDSDARIQGFVKDVLRELTFEGSADMMAVLRDVAKSDEDWQLLVLDIASDASGAMPVLLQALMSGVETLMRRSTDHIASDGLDPVFRTDLEAQLLERVRNEGMTPSSSRGLIYYTAALFSIEDRLGSDPLPAVAQFWRRVHECRPDLYDGLSTLAKALAALVESEAPLFSSAEARATPIDYIWKDFRAPERSLVEDLLKGLVELDQPLTSRQREILRFFGSELRDWERRADADKNTVYAYPFEFRIAEWMLIARAAANFGEALSVLEEFVATRFWLSIDFALCNMEFVLRHVYFDNKAVVARGIAKMREWTQIFQTHQRRQFFATLREPDPFAVNYIPIAQFAAVDAVFNTPEGSPIGVLVEEHGSGDKERAQLSLLAIRYLWREHPRKALATLRIFADGEDAFPTGWLDRILKEIYLVYPRLVEEFFRDSHFVGQRVRDIKGHEDVSDAVGFRHDGDPLFKALFLRGADRRLQVAYWYARLLQSGGFEEFCLELVTRLFQYVAFPARGER